VEQEMDTNVLEETARAAGAVALGVVGLVARPLPAASIVLAALRARTVASTRGAAALEVEPAQP
jgi:hypothetical protein